MHFDADIKINQSKWSELSSQLMKNSGHSSAPFKNIEAKSKIAHDEQIHNNVFNTIQ